MRRGQHLKGLFVASSSVQRLRQRIFLEVPVMELGAFSKYFTKKLNGKFVTPAALSQLRLEELQVGAQLQYSDLVALEIQQDLLSFFDSIGTLQYLGKR